MVSRPETGMHGELLNNLFINPLKIQHQFNLKLVCAKFYHLRTVLEERSRN